MTKQELKERIETLIDENKAYIADVKTSWDINDAIAENIILEKVLGWLMEEKKKITLYQYYYLFNKTGKIRIEEGLYKSEEEFFNYYNSKDYKIIKTIKHELEL